MDQAQNTKLQTCGFDLQRGLTESIDYGLEHLDLSCYDTSWGQWSADEGLSVHPHDHNNMTGWRTSKLNPQFPRFCPPDKMRKRRRGNYYLRFYGQHDSAKDTRSESYVFVHHGNWRQYMKQYRKYHTVGHVGRVDCEDLEWKHLLGHINIGETLKELLFNSSASLHPIPTFPTLDHWCRETSLSTMISSSTKSVEDYSSRRTPKRNLFHSFNLASVKQKKVPRPLLWMKNDCKISNKVLHDSPHDVITSRSKMVREENAGKNIKEQSSRIIRKQKWKSLRKPNSHKQVTADQTSKDSGSMEHVDQTKARKIVPRDFISEMRTARTRLGNNTVGRSLENCHGNGLSGKQSKYGELYNDIQYTLFKAEGVGSLKITNGDQIQDTSRRKKTGPDIEKEVIQNKKHSRLAKDFKSKLSLVESKPETLSSADILTDNERQHFSIVSYGSLSKVEPMRVNHREISDNAQRFAEPLPIQTIICGNKYGTVEEHETRLKASSVVP